MRSTHWIAIGVLLGALCSASLSQADLTGHWEFEEGSGGTAGNSVVGGADGVITNDATGGLGTNGSVWVTDPVFGSIISFNGAADGAYVRAGRLPLMTLEQDFTWAFLANNLEATETNNIIVGNRYDGGSPEADFSPRQFVKFTPTRFEFHMNGVGTDDLDVPDPPVDEWMHHAVVKDGAQLTYYLNGNEICTGTIFQSQDMPMPLFFGGDSTGDSGENWYGLLDDVRIYDEALTDAAVKALVPAEVAEMLGDVNDDGSVDVADFELIRANFFQDVTSRADGDLNRDGYVDYDDWNQFKFEFIASGGNWAELAGVPEPSTGVLFALLTSVSMLRRRRKRAFPV